MTRPRITEWNPEDEAFWNATGSAIARRNMICSVFTEHIGFAVWTMWSTLVLFLGPAYGLTPDQKFTLVCVPAAVGAGLRIPYSLAVARVGGRDWTIISAALLLLPTITTAVLLEPGISYHSLLWLGALTGFGGGNFASSMSNINSFYPERKKGWALGINAAGGNLGVAMVQLLGLLVLATAGAAHPRILVGVFVPLIVVGAATCAVFMDNLPQRRNEKRAIRDACAEPHTWVISFLYIGTFGSFIGFGFAFGQVLLVQFPEHFSHVVMVKGTPKVMPDPVKAAYLTFLGPLIGSIARPLGGWLADRKSGSVVTFWNFVAMIGAALIVLEASLHRSLPLFLVGFIALFIAAGLGNGSTYKMIPALFRGRAVAAIDSGQDPTIALAQARRRTGAVIGIAGAIGAFGGVLVNISLRQSFLHHHNGNTAYKIFVGFYVLCALITWAVYLRPRHVAVEEDAAAVEEPSPVAVLTAGPVPPALVTVSDTSGAMVTSGWTDAEGVYRLEVAHAGTVLGTLNVRVQGYESTVAAPRLTNGAAVPS